MIDQFVMTNYVASKVCHDIIAPMGVITQSIEMLELLSDPAEKAEYETLLRETADAIAARLPFLRFVFGSQGLADNPADMPQLKSLADKFVGLYKPSLTWQIEHDDLSYSHMRLLLLMIMIGVDGLHFGGDLVAIARKTGDGGVDLEVRGSGDRVHYRHELIDTLAGREPEGGLLPKDCHPIFAHQIAERFGTSFKAETGPTSLTLTVLGIPPREDV